jgi:hypothetical protein
VHRTNPRTLARIQRSPEHAPPLACGRPGAVRTDCREHSVRSLYCCLGLDPEQVRWQEGRVDLLLTRLGVKHLIIEVKRPGSLDGPGSIARAFRQARGYAEQYNVRTVAVSDGGLFEVRDLSASSFGLRLRTHLPTLRKNCGG